MRKRRLHLHAFCMCMLYWQVATAQQPVSSFGKVLHFPSSFISKIQDKYCHLEERLEEIREFISNRKPQIKEGFNKYTNLPKGTSNSFSVFNKEVYYYGQQWSGDIRHIALSNEGVGLRSFAAIMPAGDLNIITSN